MKKNRIKGIIIVRENTVESPKMIKINAFVMLLVRMIVAFFVVSVAVLVIWWSTIVQHITSYRELRHKNDSLHLSLKQADTLKAKIEKIDNFLEYFKMVSSIDYKNTPPTIDEYLKNIVSSGSNGKSGSNIQQEFKKIPRIRPVTGIISRGFDKSIPHEAIDFVAPLGSPIRATADGVVLKVFVDEHMGNVVVLKHSDGYESLYGHCREILVNEGAAVVQGETIAFVGSSGNTTSGVHLHYEVTKDGKAINPEELFL